MMSSTPSSTRREDDGVPQASHDPNPPTVAAFSPVTLSHAPSANKQRSTILVHQKSPLLIATPPQITRALAYSHPFLLPLNKFVGLLTWTTGDPWESFLLVAAFWAVVLYGDSIMRFAGPLVVVIGLILGMYSRRYSPLSSTGWTGEKQKKGHKRAESEATSLKHQKTLDEIVETLKIFTSRCNVLLDPLLELTDFLSTQRTATSATTRPALTTLLIRILLVTPFWILLSLRPIQIITTKRIVLATGTIFFTWHSRPTRVSRTILWRSATVRRFCTIITGLNFPDVPAPPKTDEEKPEIPPKTPSAYQEGAHLAATSAARRRPDAPGVKFTFILYENQRRWVGLGWTTSLFAYERAAWTDEHLNPAPTKEEFELPDVEEGTARWRWVEGSKWLVEGAGELDEGGRKGSEDAHDGGTGWIYYDNKWQNGRRGQDGWGRYTRRRKWYRDAELVEISPSTEITPSPTPTRATSITPPKPKSIPIPTTLSSPSPTTALTTPSITTTSLSSSLPTYDLAEKSSITSKHSAETASIKSHKSSASKSSTSKGFRPDTLRRRGTGASRASSLSYASDDEMAGAGRLFGRATEADWGIGDDARMGLE
ncbi:integral peroxisomal membrane peroxin-domain-containing protein [Tricladium varicosporioides]|nr:integral peroxisomal membrane peroxin-domain-containing protein [Hymenoscyphus varicosporioides]